MCSMHPVCVAIASERELRASDRNLMYVCLQLAAQLKPKKLLITGNDAKARKATIRRILPSEDVTSAASGECTGGRRQGFPIESACKANHTMCSMRPVCIAIASHRNENTAPHTEISCSVCLQLAAQLKQELLITGNDAKAWDGHQRRRRRTKTLH
jgi:hypothetical protein